MAVEICFPLDTKLFLTLYITKQMLLLVEHHTAETTLKNTHSKPKSGFPNNVDIRL